MNFIAVLKCYGPNNGPVIGQIFLLENGAVEVHGEIAIARQRFVQLLRGGAGIPVPEPKLHKTEYGNSTKSYRRRGRPRKHFHEAEYVAAPML